MPELETLLYSKGFQRTGGPASRLVVEAQEEQEEKVEQGVQELQRIRLLAEQEAPPLGKQVARTKAMLNS